MTGAVHEPVSLRPGASAPLATALGIALAALLASGCSPEELDRGVPSPSAPSAAPPDVSAPPPADPERAARSGDEPRDYDEFEDTSDLLRTIEQGAYADRVDVEALAMPRPMADPIEVPFESGTEVPAEQIPKLVELAGRILDRDDAKVDVLGCSDPSGPAALNVEISTRRARAVEAVLREAGLDDARIGDVQGRGEACDVQERFVRVTPVAREGSDRNRAESAESAEERAESGSGGAPSSES